MAPRGVSQPDLLNPGGLLREGPPKAMPVNAARLRAVSKPGMQSAQERFQAERARRTTSFK